MKKTVSYTVPMKKGGHIALRHLPNSGHENVPVIVTHGTISNSSAVEELAIYLNQLGFDCWLLEWGGHGASQAFSNKQNFEFPALNDTPAAIDIVLKETQHKKVYWVSHSGGGHLPLMCLSRMPEYREKLAGIVTIGAQSTDAALGMKLKLRTLLLYLVTKVMGETPKQIVAAGTEGEPTQLLAQWSKWNLNKKWLGTDGLDYLAALTNITTPALMIAGGNDNIAPVTGCRKLYNALGSSDKGWLVYDKGTGFSKDFSHGQLIRGSAAREEVFPRIGQWLKERNGQH